MLSTAKALVQNAMPSSEQQTPSAGFTTSHPLTSPKISSKDIVSRHQGITVVARMLGKDGRPKPYVGPGLEDYKKLHATTIGDNSDEFWANVSDDPDIDLVFLDH